MEAEQSLLRSAEDRLDSLRGVNLDEEATNLIRYQQAYQALRSRSFRWRTIFSTHYSWRQDDDWKNVFSSNASGKLKCDLRCAGALAKTQEALATGKKINSASDDPVASAQITAVRAELSRLGGDAEECEYCLR